VTAAATSASAPRPVPPIAAEPARPRSAPGGAPVTPESRSKAPRIELRPIAAGLPAGPVELVGEAQVVLATGGRARAFATREVATVELASGTLELHVEKHPPQGGHRFEVDAPPYRFTVLGTRFRVVRGGQTVKLDVTEGRVAVFQGQRLLGVIDAGHGWQGAIEPKAAPAGDHASAATRPRCGQRAARDARDGLDCYLAEARGDDLSAEVALYEAARLQRDALADPVAALATLRQSRRRFPSGTLRIETALSIAELLPRLGRYQEALEQTTALLGDGPGDERLGELQLLRGHILREGFHDCAGAERAYTAAIDAAAETTATARSARAADPATFWRAVCLQSLGRRDEARAAFGLYLARPGAAFSAQARARLDALDREHPEDTKAQKGRTETGGGSHE
jgi:hypothetical protein